MNQIEIDPRFNEVHLYNILNLIITVFNKLTNKFITTGQISKDEETELLAPGNFDGPTNFVNGKTLNLTSDYTKRNHFKYNIIGVTSIDKSELNNC